MQNRLIQIAAAVPALKVGDIDYNTQSMISVIEECSESGIIVFPELSVTGYTCADLFLSNLLLNKSIDALVKIADATTGKRVTAVVGVPFVVDNNLYNCAAVLSDGKIKALIPKTFIPTYSEFYECRWFASGRDLNGRTVTIDGQEVPVGTDILLEDERSGAVLGVEICEDLWVPDKPSTHAALAGANIIVNLSASDELIGKREYRTSLVRQQSGSCYCAYVYVSSGAMESSTDLVFSGHSIIAQNGSLLSESIFPQYPHVETALVDLAVIMHDRIRQNTFENGSNYRRVSVNIRPAGSDEPSIREMSRMARPSESRCTSLVILGSPLFLRIKPMGEKSPTEDSSGKSSRSSFRIRSIE